jgi:TolB protein
MMLPRRLTMLGGVAIAAGVTSPARAQLTIDMTRPTFEPVPIAIVDFKGDAVGTQMAGVIRNDLQNSGLFRVIPSSAYIQQNVDASTPPRFPDWRSIGAAGLVVGQVTSTGGNIKVDFRLWDVVSSQQATGLSFNSQPSNWRRLAHIIADAIYKRITGEDGYFDTRIVYIAESGPQNRRIKRLAIMDQDGANHRFLTDGRVLVLTPRFSPTAQEITYLSYFRDQPRVYLFNIDTGQQEVVGDFPGMTFAPRFSPDGKRVIMSLSTEGNSQIYALDLRTRAVKRLTNHASINTSPCYSPDGNWICFNSDRSGGQQLYTMDAEGGSVKRVSFGQGRYATPVWSPRGDLLAFTKFTSAGFAIGVMRPDGSGERILTESFLVEGPTWAPNGRVLMYFRQQPTDDQGRGGSVRLFSIDLTGFNEREIITPVDGSDPAWSPLIP